MCTEPQFIFPCSSKKKQEKNHNIFEVLYADIMQIFEHSSNGVATLQQRLYAGNW